MKKLKVLTLLFSFVVFISCSNEDNFVLNMESDNINDLINVKLVDKTANSEILVTTSFLKNKWEKQSLEEGYEVEFEIFQILESIDTETKQKYYFLKATSKDNTIQTGAFLTKEGENIYSLNNKECSCKGCTDGCNLSVIGSNCRCSSCFQNDGKCEKTEKIVIGNV